ncbi:MAG: hypothetical protein OEW37_05725 [Rhodospirillaceae bacterium]|nr:hypothetical protein [Rhodospirillaceae bacterium]
MDTISANEEPIQKQGGWKSHPINFRFSLPFFGKRFYLTLVAGGEQRSPQRISEERAKHPVLTAGNVFFSFGITTVFLFLAVVALAMQSAILEM